MPMALNVGQHTRRDYFLVDPNKVTLREDLRGRHVPPSEADIIALAESMLTHGQLQPVLGRRVDPGNKVEIVAGFTRTAAARLIRAGFTGTDGKHKQDEKFCLQLKVTDLNPEEAFTSNVVENAHRNLTSPIDDAFNQRRLSDTYGKTDTEIAALYGYRDTSKVSRLRKLLQLDKATQALIHSGEMSVQAGLDLLDVPEPERAKVVEKATQENGRVNGRAVRQEARESLSQSVLNDDGKIEAPVSEEPAAAPVKPKSKARTLSEVREFLESLDGPGSKQGVRELSKKLLEFFAGRVGEKGLLATMERVCK